MENSINKFFSEKKFAIFGVSENPKKFGNYIYKELSSKNFQLYPISNKNIEGIVTYQSIKDIDNSVKSAIICTKPKNSIEIIKELKNSGIENVWFQQGSESIDAIEIAKENNLNVISKKCVIMYSEPVTSIHKFHRGILKFFGKY